jgi:hypothetical protein
MVLGILDKDNLYLAKMFFIYESKITNMFRIGLQSLLADLHLKELLKNVFQEREM